MNQSDFFERWAAADRVAPPDTRDLVHADDPPTSREAVDNMTASGERATHMLAILKAVIEHPHLTSSELAKRHSPYDLTETRRRLTDLKNRRLVTRGLARLCGVAGTRQVTWFATDLGKGTVRDE